jgi:RNA polymerase sigma-70 factor (ECF subfamily)
VSEVGDSVRTVNGPAGGAEFEALVRRHSPALRQYCRHLAGPVDGDDLMQDTLARAMVGFRRLRDRERFLPWCRQIARNTNATRVKARHPTEELPDVASPIDLETEIVDGMFRRVVIAEAFAAMPERNRSVLSARADGVSPAALAEQYGVSRTLVDTWFARSRAQARRLLDRAPEAGMLGTAAALLARLRAPVTARRAAVVAATGVGATTLLLTLPHVLFPDAGPAPPPTATLSPVGHSGQIGRIGRTSSAQTDARPQAPSGSVHVPWPAWVHRMKSSTSGAPRHRAVDLPQTGPYNTDVAHQAEADPISIGPLAPGDQLILGVNQCNLLAKVEPRPCPTVLAGIRVKVAPR